MSDTQKMKVALIDQAGAVTFAFLFKPPDIEKPSCNFIEAYLDELGHERNGWAVHSTDIVDQKTNYIAAVDGGHSVTSELVRPEQLEDAQYFVFVGLDQQ